MLLDVGYLLVILVSFGRACWFRTDACIGPKVVLLLQGAQLMSQYGINVPPGIAVKSVDEVASAAKKMASPDGEVRLCCGLSCHSMAGCRRV